MSDETKQMQAAARASLNILFNRLVEHIETAEQAINTHVAQIAMSETVSDARQAVQKITGVVGHLRLTPDGKRARQIFTIAVDNFNRCLCYPTEFWEYPEWQELLRVCCNMVESTLEKLRILTMPEELVLLEAGIIQGLGMRFSAFDRDLLVERDETQTQKGKQPPTLKESQKGVALPAPKSDWKTSK